MRRTVVVLLFVSGCGTGPPITPLLDAGLDAPPRLDAPPGMDAPAEPDVGPPDAPLDAVTSGDPPLPDVPLDVPPDDAPDDAGVADDVEMLPDTPPPDVAFDAAGCGTLVTEHPPVPSPHVPACDPVTYGSVPPTSGPHYPSWPAFGPYASPIPWGFLVHALEHGAVVVTYDCPSGCDAEVAALLGYLDTRPADPLCSRDVHHRVIVAPVPPPGLGHRFMVSAWGWGLTSDCFDLPALGAFLDARYAMGPENFCADGATGLACLPDAGTDDAGP